MGCISGIIMIYVCQINFNTRTANGGVTVDILIGDVLTMKKPHPCGENKLVVLRIGMDFKLRCPKCSHEFMTPRNKIEKNVKSVLRDKLL